VNVFVEEAVENFNEKCYENEEDNTNRDKSTFNWEATAA